MKRIYWSFLLLSLSGCAILEAFTEHGEEIEATGKALEDVAPGLTAINPQLGLIVLIGGGILLAIGAALKKKG